jgi:hypothetical protein
MKHVFVLMAFVAMATGSLAQVVNTATMDTSSFAIKGKVTVEGYIDAYYAYNFNNPGKDQPYFVSMARNNEVNINLAYVDVKYSSSRIRARFVPGFGTYVNSNYAAEKGTLKNIIEGSIGVKISKKKNIWIDAGVFGSPYTNESAISKDHLAYTRSMAAENVPYYLAGVKLGLPIAPKLNAYVYILNGWQRIEDPNNKMSMGTQLEYRPNDYLLINWDTYAGQESSAADSTQGNRFFNDLYFIFTKGKFSATGCFYYGVQQQSESTKANWWQANLIGRYDLNTKLSVTGRIERFTDPRSVMLIPITSAKGGGFSANSSSLGLNYKLAENTLLRLEGRTFFSDKEMFMKDGAPVKTSNTVTGNITIWF